MPYVVDGKCVYKKKSDGSKGEKVGCTDGPVKDYLAALHANVDENLQKEIKKMKIKPERLKEIIDEEVEMFLKESEDEEHKKKMLDVADEIEDAAEEIEDEYMPEVNVKYKKVKKISVEGKTYTISY